ncbi:MAG: hypothetical protein WAT19_14790 [Ferruginibacter sp.]
MKKLILLATSMLIYGMLLAQDNGKATVEKNAFLTLSGGPSFPVGDFGKTGSANAAGDLINEGAGFAKTGYNFNLTCGYFFAKNAGVTVGLFYNNYPTKPFTMTIPDSEIQSISLDMGKWKYYGISAGPVMSFGLTKKLVSDVKIMAAAVSVKSPKISYSGIVMAEGSTNWAPAFSGGIDLRYNTGKSWFVYANADYMYLQPKFTYTYTADSELSGTDKVTQKINAVNVNVGIGYSF